MTVTVYKYTDVGAPVLSGTAGALIGVLDACLVTGYGSKEGAGWTKAFTGTNRASYKQPINSNGFYLDVDDTGVTDTGKCAKVCGFEAMTAVGVGSGQFPNLLRRPLNLFLIKSNVADSSARGWYLYTNGKIFYLVVHTTSMGSEIWLSYGSAYAFGDINSFRIDDKFNTIISMSETAAFANYQLKNVGTLAAMDFCYFARSYTQLGASVPFGKHINSNYANSGSIGAGNLPYPDPVAGSILLSPVWLAEVDAIRGTLPGILNSYHPVSAFTHGDIINGNGEYAGRKYEVNKLYGVSVIFIEISNTW